MEYEGCDQLNELLGLTEAFLQILDQEMLVTLLTEGADDFHATRQEPIQKF